MKPEQLLYTRIHAALTSQEWDVQRVENTIGRGIPDITACCPALGEVWIEAKADKKRPRLRPEQYAWMKRRAHFGGQCCVVIQDEYREWHVWPISDSSRFGVVGSYLVPSSTERCAVNQSLILALFDLYGNQSAPRPEPDRSSGDHPAP